jgi:hypothetical protein
VGSAVLATVQVQTKKQRRVKLSLALKNAVMKQPRRCLHPVACRPPDGLGLHPALVSDVPQDYHFFDIQG